MNGFRLTGEPALEDLLSDPIVHMIMQRDQVSADDIRAVADQARRNLRLREIKPNRMFSVSV